MQDLKYGSAGANAPTVAINAAGCILFAALFLADQRAADMRITRRIAVQPLSPMLKLFQPNAVQEGVNSLQGVRLSLILFAGAVSTDQEGG